MFLIVGLGNPGKEYDGTRHNIGFAAVDYIADKYNIELNRIKFKGVFGEGFIDGKKVILLKPTEQRQASARLRNFSIKANYVYELKWRKY